MNDIRKNISFDEISDLNDQFHLGETDQEILLTNSTDHVPILDHMVQQARSSIRIFTRDLDPLLYDRRDFTGACKQLAIRSRYARVEILAFNSQRIIHRGHHLLELARRLSSRIEIRQPDKEHEKHIQAFITFDERGYIYRNYDDRYEATANFNDPRKVRELEKFFEYIWQRSNVSTEMRGLNI